MLSRPFGHCSNTVSLIDLHSDCCEGTKHLLHRFFEFLGTTAIHNQIIKQLMILSVGFNRLDV